MTTEQFKEQLLADARKEKYSNTEQTTVLAVDGDILAYRTAAVCENDFEGAAEAILRATLRDISTDTKVHNMRIYLSGDNNFRYEVAKTKPYKGNRTTMVQPQYLKFCKEFLIKEFKAIRCHGYEADDGIATDMTINNAIHCGIDKDILQIPGLHYNYVNKEWRDIGEEEATILLYRQILMGDASDNVPGLPRVGAKTAEKVIYSAETAESDAIEYYKEVCEAKMPEINYMVYMAEQKNLISMVRDAKVTFDHTIFVEPTTDGFSSQEGDFEGQSIVKRVDVRL